MLFLRVPQSISPRIAKVKFVVQGTHNSFQTLGSERRQQALSHGPAVLGPVLPSQIPLQPRGPRAPRMCLWPLSPAQLHRHLSQAPAQVLGPSGSGHLAPSSVHNRTPHRHHIWSCKNSRQGRYFQAHLAGEATGQPTGQLGASAGPWCLESLSLGISCLPGFIPWPRNAILLKSYLPSSCKGDFGMFLLPGVELFFQRNWKKLKWSHQL